MEDQQPNEATTDTPTAPDELTSDEKNMAMLCHLLGIFTSFLGH